MTNYIDITRLRVMACHGCHEFEQREAQPFVFSARLETDFSAGARADELSGTVSYSDVMKCIAAHATGHSYRLIETLADRVARELLLSFPAVRRVTLTVEKPQAPVKLDFETVSVTLSLGWTETAIALGSNLGDKKGYLDFAVAQLRADPQLRVKRISRYLETPPWGGVATQSFLNGALLAETLYTPHELLSALQAIERAGDRVRKEHWGDRTLDLDIIFYGQEIIDAPDLKIPHPYAAERRFVLEPLAEIAPYYRSPLHGEPVCALLKKLS